MSASVAELNLALSSAEITAAICDIESVSGNEKKLADAIEKALASLPHLHLTRDGDAIIARTDFGHNRRVLIAGHIDTVPVNKNLPTKLEGDVLWGRGTVDMKAGVAVALKLAAELTNPSVDLTWVFYDHEEVDSSLNGLGRLATAYPDLLQADFAILGEPTNAMIEGGCNGTLRVEVHTSGVRAHSARSWKGENAIHKLSPALDALARYQPETITVDGLDYREGLNAVGISGGVAGNVIPDQAVLTVNYRFAPSKNIAEAYQHVQKVFEGYDLVMVDSADGARPGLNAPIAQEFVTAVGSEPQPKYGWTDVARFSALGIPAGNFGPGDPSLAHADDERVEIAQILACENALRSWLNS